MLKKLCILLVFCKSENPNRLIHICRMHSFYAIFVKFLDICKQKAVGWVNEQGNMPRPGVVPRFSDLEVITLGLTAEALGIDSESLLFSRLKESRREIPHLLSRRQYNDRRKSTAPLCQCIRERMAREMDGGEDCFCIDSMPVEVCRMARARCCMMGRKDTGKAPSYGYCAAQGTHYYGYKLHAVCGLNGGIHSSGLTKASVHSIT